VANPITTYCDAGERRDLQGPVGGVTGELLAEARARRVVNLAYWPPAVPSHSAYLRDPRVRALLADVVFGAPVAPQPIPREPALVHAHA
jgi:hypothetical protein